MFDISKYAFYRALCPQYPHYCDGCEHEVFDMKDQIWICPYDRFSDVLRQVSVLEAEHAHRKDESL